MTVSMGTEFGKVPVLFVSESECCGCGACSSVCPKDAIDMLPNRYGFLYPRINADLCIGCRMCVRVCSVISK